jgi:transcriptional regulator with XRE-family HTH domain
VAQETGAVLREIGLRIREVRRSRGLTQEQAAERLGMLAPNYARIEQGRANVTVDTLVRVATTLSVPVAALFRKQRSRRYALVGPRRSLEEAPTSLSGRGRRSS